MQALLLPSLSNDEDTVPQMGAYTRHRVSKQQSWDLKAVVLGFKC